MYVASMTEAPLPVTYLEVVYKEDQRVVCQDCGCQYLESEIESSFIHSAKIKSKPFEYGGKRVKMFHRERCPICTGGRIANLNTNLQ